MAARLAARFAAARCAQDPLFWRTGVVVRIEPADPIRKNDGRLALPDYTLRLNAATVMAECGVAAPEDQVAARRDIHNRYQPWELDNHA
jgi:hypothetical protein